MGVSVPEGFDWKNPDYAPIIEARMQWIGRLRDKPEDVLALRKFYADRPAEFISDFCWTFDPRNADLGKSTVIPFMLFPEQVDFIGWLYEKWRGRDNGLAEKSRDMGVTWLCAAFGVWMWTFHPGSVVGFGSRKEEYVDKIGDPKSIFWKVRFLVEYLPREFKPAGYSDKVHAPHMRVVNPETNSVILGEAGDNIGRGNRTSIYFLDEAAFIERPEAVEAALSQTTNCRIDCSTPNGAGNLFYRKRHGNKVDVFVFDWKDDPRKGPEWYEDQKRKLDPVTLAQEVDRDYEGSVGDAWFPGAAITEAMRRGPADVMPQGGLKVGVDVARFGDDKSVITLRRGRVVLKFEKRGKIDVVQVASWVKEELRPYGKPEQIAVDTIGIGAGVADILRSDGYFPDVQMGNGKVRKTVVDVNSAIRLDDGKNYNLRAAMARAVKEWLEAGASLPNDQDIKAGMGAIKYSFKGGLLLLESKDDMKGRGLKSPDEYDSLALTFAVPSVVVEEPPPQADYVPAMSGVGM
jgi:phage terminase large subunit